MNAARGNLLIRPVETAETYAGGRIVIPEGARERLAAQQAEVVSVGPDALCEDDECERTHDHGEDGRGRPIRFHPCPLKAGAWVIVQKYAGVELEGDLRVIAQDDVIAVLAP